MRIPHGGLTAWGRVYIGLCMGFVYTGVCTNSVHIGVPGISLCRLDLMFKH